MNPVVSGSYMLSAFVVRAASYSGTGVALLRLEGLTDGLTGEEQQFFCLLIGPDFLNSLLIEV
jgi:hypothetical protein